MIGGLNIHIYVCVLVIVLKNNLPIQVVLWRAIGARRTNYPPDQPTDQRKSKPVEVVVSRGLKTISSELLDDKLLSMFNIPCPIG